MSAACSAVILGTAALAASSICLTLVGIVSSFFFGHSRSCGERAARDDEARSQELRQVSFFQTQSDGRCRAAFGAVRRTSARTDDRDQGFAGLADDRAIGLHRAQVRSAEIAFFAFLAR